jgi:hypothetical protein
VRRCPRASSPSIWSASLVSGEVIIWQWRGWGQPDSPVARR